MFYCFTFFNVVCCYCVFAFSFFFKSGSVCSNWALPGFELCVFLHFLFISVCSKWTQPGFALGNNSPVYKVRGVLYWNSSKSWPQQF